MQTPTNSHIIYSIRMDLLFHGLSYYSCPISPIMVVTIHPVVIVDGSELYLLVGQLTIPDGDNNSGFDC